MIGDILSPRAVIAALAARGKKQLLQDLSVQAAPFAGCAAHAVFDALWAREMLGTTGIGNGLAIPHARIKGLDEVMGFFARLDEPIAFAAVDDKPVDLVFVLLSPESAAADHLEALSAVAGFLREAKLCAALRRADDAAAIYELLTGVEAAVAA